MHHRLPRPGGVPCEATPGREWVPGRPATELQGRPDGRKPEPAGAGGDRGGEKAGRRDRCWVDLELQLACPLRTSELRGTKACGKACDAPTAEERGVRGPSLGSD